MIQLHSIDQETKHEFESTMGTVVQLFEVGSWDFPTSPQEYTSYLHNDF